MRGWGTTFLSMMALTASLGGCAPQEETDDGEASDNAALTVADVPADPDQAQRVLYLDAPPPSSCANESGDARIRCLITARYAADVSAQSIALELFRSTGGVAGVAPEQTLEDGYRGKLHLVPELPIGAYSKHLTFVRDAARDFDGFFKGIGAAAQAPLAYRWRTVNFRFFRSVGRTTPSAYTEGTWEAFYNVSGSLVSTPAAVRETLFHELFHVNDWNHGQWSSRVLAPIVAEIAARCGTSTACLAPFTPTDTIVKNGTYYAFQPNNGPLEVEYSAELAIRYYTEQRAALAHQRLAKRPFKCGPAQNARAWDLLVREFFGGADLTGPCEG